MYSIKKAKLQSFFYILFFYSFFFVQVLKCSVAWILSKDIYTVVGEIGAIIFIIRKGDLETSLTALIVIVLCLKMIWL